MESRRFLVEQLSSLSELVVRQRKEWGEILSGFETRNKYQVSDAFGNNLYVAVEEPGSTMIRWFLKALRPFTITVFTENHQVVLQVIRPFRFYFHRADIFDSAGRTLGAIERQFSLLNRIYSIRGPYGKEEFQLFGPLMHPWTFSIQKEGISYGTITKKWTGFLKEGFTDADNFGITFPVEWDVQRKAVFLGILFLIDFVHFENKGGR